MAIPYDILAYFYNLMDGPYEIMDLIENKGKVSMFCHSLVFEKFEIKFKKLHSLKNNVSIKPDRPFPINHASLILQSFRYFCKHEKLLLINNYTFCF